MNDRESRIKSLQRAAEARTEAKREEVIRTLRAMERAKRPVSLNAVAKGAKVSRGFIYGQSDLLAQVEEARKKTSQRLVAAPTVASQASLQARLAAALDALSAARNEVAELSQRVERLTAEVTRLQAVD